MNKNLYYGIAALSAVGIIGIGSVSAEFIEDKFEHKRGGDHHERLEKMSEVIGFDLDDIKSKLDSGEKLKDIFEELGLEREDVHEQMKAAHKEQVNLKLEAGETSQEQADRRLEKIENHKVGDHKDKRGEHKKERSNKPSPEKMSEVLGLDIDEVKGEIEAGKTMKEVLEARGIEKEFVHEQMQAFHKDQVNQKLEAGEITQEQAEDRLQKISERKPGEGPRRDRGNRPERS